ncbi:hypothetical protein MVLG_05686 [Microbotryum lychnidis-dioicae p1A1 Lamole]|uniref:Uncharacterized protein n=1 Tax=Microbotryum lychnidis-dioicae (strain p1A1 Lamole / MvSl-1064) TaxID=683840 RepID=U5HEZ8_USTV1|nr:hypothetical protein MVLG_05686 [Microbotryum lychnidis-dioicae p1A1 Lamole]|eukprot:KDE03864.1 hypothetical protein MVLG_05686 [Microbotryum lychnidis-dioicae p1A1 Lamole]
MRLSWYHAIGQLHPPQIPSSSCQPHHQPLAAVVPESDDSYSELALPRKYARIHAANTATHRKKPTTERSHGKIGATRMVRVSPALQRYLEEADLQRDRRVEAIEVPHTHKWGSEADMVPLVKAIMGVASESTDRAFVVCGRSNDTVPTAQGQVPSDDHCADIVCLYPHATTPETIEEWLRTDLERLIGEKASSISSQQARRPTPRRRRRRWGAQGIRAPGQ